MTTILQPMLLLQLNLILFLKVVIVTRSILVAWERHTYQLPTSIPKPTCVFADCYLRQHIARGNIPRSRAIALITHPNPNTCILYRNAISCLNNRLNTSCNDCPVCAPWPKTHPLCSALLCSALLARYNLPMSCWASAALLLISQPRRLRSLTRTKH